MKTDDMIDVTDVPLEAMVRAVYNLSRPQGLGRFHYQPGDLTDDEVKSIVAQGGGGMSFIDLSMDYVKGRACKMTVFKHEGRHYIPNRWYDHSDSQLRELLSGLGIDPAVIDKAREKDAA